MTLVLQPVRFIQALISQAGSQLVSCVSWHHASIRARSVAAAGAQVVASSQADEPEEVLEEDAGVVKQEWELHFVMQAREGQPTGADCLLPWDM